MNFMVTSNAHRSLGSGQRVTPVGDLVGIKMTKKDQFKGKNSDQASLQCLLNANFGAILRLGSKYIL